MAIGETRLANILKQNKTPIYMHFLLRPTPSKNENNVNCEEFGEGSWTEKHCFNIQSCTLHSNSYFFKGYIKSLSEFDIP